MFLLRWSSRAKSLNTSQGSSHANKLWYVPQALAPPLLLQLVLQNGSHTVSLSQRVIYAGVLTLLQNK